MWKRHTLSVLFSLFVFYIKADDPLTELGNINITELFQGIKVSDEVKKQLIECIGAAGNDEPTYERCPDVPMPNTFKKLFSLTNVINKVTPIETLLSPVEDVRKKLITDPLSNLKEGIQSKLSDAPTKVSDIKAKLSGAEKEADDLIKFASTITASTRKPSPYDPFQDISAYIKEVQKANIIHDTAAIEVNRKNLRSMYANTDFKTIKRYGANYNPLVPAVLEVGILRQILHT